MESEHHANINPREHLGAFNEAARSAEAEAHVETPLWFWPVVALAAPASVAFQRLDGLPRNLVVSILVVAVLLALAEMTRRGKRAAARANSPARGGRFIIWRFPAMFFMIFGFQLTTLLDWDSGLLLAGFTYLVIAIGTTYSWHKADQQMIALTSKVSPQ